MNDLVREAKSMCVGLVTAPDEATGQRIARSLVEERLAACVNVLSTMQSVFRWQGKVEEAPEVLMILKSRTDQKEALVERINALHPYDVPELLFIEVSAASDSYLRWVETESKP